MSMDSMILKSDPISTERLKTVYPDVRTRWLRLAQDFYSLHGLALRIAQGLRTYPDQQAIFEKGRTLENGLWVPVDPVHFTGIVTWAKPGDSWHHFSAIDSCFINGQDPWLDQHPDKDFLWSEYARLGEANGFEAGYRWEGKKQDRPHLQIRYGGMLLADVKKIYEIGKLRGVWTKFDQIRKADPGSEWSSPELLATLNKMGVL